MTCGVSAGLDITGFNGTATLFDIVLGAVQLKCTSKYLCTRGQASSPNVAIDASRLQWERPEHLIFYIRVNHWDTNS